MKKASTLAITDISSYHLRFAVQEHAMALALFDLDNTLLAGDSDYLWGVFLVDKGLVDRINGGGRSFVYGLAPNENHPAHPHFFCKSCGNLECLNPQSLRVDLQSMQRTFPGMIENVAVRVDGVCKNCLRR